MSFMEHEITDRQTWVEIEGTNGLTYVPSDVDPRIKRAINSGNDSDAEELSRDYYDGLIYSVDLTEGIGARLSAPGYLDCTEWSVFETTEDAEAHLRDVFGDEDSEDEYSEQV